MREERFLPKESGEMTALVTGIYKEGKIELLETPPGLREGHVRVLVLEAPEGKTEPRFLQRGKYGSDPRRMSTLEDFKAAEWSGEEEFADADGG
jgi:hypothetical protein